MTRMRPATLAMAALLVFTVSFALPVQPSPGASAVRSPVDVEFSAPGPYATATGVVTQGSTVEYDLFYPRRYSALGFKSPLVTWGNGTFAVPDMYSTLLRHFASYGFTVIATTLTNTGSGREIDAAAHYLVRMNSTRGSVFDGHLDVHRVAAVGHSQGATGAARVAIMDPKLISTLMTFSLPEARWAGTNSDCPVVTDCEENMHLVHQPAFLISTHGPLDAIIASPSAELAYFDQVQGRAALGIVATSEGAVADHSSIQNAANGGHPGGELGYATAWLEFTLRGNRRAASAFEGLHPELVANPDWPGSRVRS
jgi:pimeloyl-ACP methyl ester carboxylesterase